MREAKSKSQLISTTTTTKIPFHDVDMMEVAWHGHYVKYFEIARCTLLDKIGYNYRDMKASGYAWPVVDLHIKYVRPARFGQLINISCSVREYENRLVLDFLIVDQETGEKLTRGRTIQVAVDMKTQELQLVSPPVLIEKLEAHL